MRIALALVMLSVPFMATEANNQARSGYSSVVTFPKNGPLSVTAGVKQGEHPQITFRSQRTGRTLLQTSLGDENWKEFAVKDDPDALDQTIKFVVIHRPDLPDPLIIALVRRQGGSDCSYLGAIFGEIDGTLTELTPQLPDFLTRGDMRLSKVGSGKPPTLTITSERYEWDKDVHYKGPSRVAVFLYAYDPTHGKFVLSKKHEVKTDDLKLSGEDIVTLFGDFPNC